jgi:UPF0271 protein
MRTIDLNCDMGESFGAWNMGDDDAVLPHVTSVNVACGLHAGDWKVMHYTVQAAFAHRVSVGAHPSLPDLQGFGRRVMQISADEVYDLVLYQVGALDAFCRALDGRLAHVKAHGALYNMAARDEKLAQAMAQAVADLDPGLVLFGLAGSALIKAGRDAGLRVANEVFADRSYRADGSLTPRNVPGSMIEDVQASLAQVEDMVMRGRVRSQDGTEVSIEADTICIHGDQPGAAQFAREVRGLLARSGIEVAAPGNS